MLHSQTHPYSNPRLDAEEFRPILVEKFNLFYLWGSRLLWPSYGQAYKQWGFPWGFHGFNITRLGIASSMGVFPWGCMPGVSNLHMLGYNPYNYGYVSHLFVELQPKYGLGAREWI